MKKDPWKYAISILNLLYDFIAKSQLDSTHFRSFSPNFPLTTFEIRISLYYTKTCLCQGLKCVLSKENKPFKMRPSVTSVTSLENYIMLVLPPHLPGLSKKIHLKY